MLSLVFWAMKMASFIVFEGLDGTGKSTLSQSYCDYLNARGVAAVRVTTGYPAIDTAILSLKNDSNYNITSHFLLAMANSIMCYKNIIEPLLRDGKTVIVDRYFPTTIAYNVASGMDYSWARNVSKVIPLPDRIIYCSCELETQLSRKQNKIDSIETGFSYDSDKGRAFLTYQKKVSCVYERLILESPMLYSVLNTENSILDCLLKIDNLLGGVSYEKRK